MSWGNGGGFGRFAICILELSAGVQEKWGGGPKIKVFFLDPNNLGPPFLGNYQMDCRFGTSRLEVLLSQQSMPYKEHASSFQANPKP